MNNNQKAIQLLDEWFDDPDDMGEDFWDEYGQNLVPFQIGVPWHQHPAVRALTGKQ
ncbi:hypothetical protein LCGC14_1737120 [marine sediment metagenome]|uniref:Uncharacterized protein n=1 Tax=marine sediment metagenome TaxID=412755 RepID=A0A0F9HVF2_9ZZZZ